MRSVRAAVPFACALACAVAASAQAPVPSPAPAAVPPAAAQPGTDLFLLDVALRGRAVELGKPVRLTERAGYDNQPAFSADGRTVYFTAIADGNADIQELDLATRRITPVLSSAESEYSPTPAPGGGLSVVRVETNDTQRLWRIGDDGKTEVLLPGIKPVGYHAWRDADTLVLFVLGDPPTLVVAERGSGRAETVARDVGRCIRAVPGRPAVSFVEKAARGEWWLSEVTFPSRAIKRIARMPQGVEDYAWLGGARVLAGQGNRLLELTVPGGAWQERARFDAPELQNVTRLALSPAGDRLVLVSDEATPFPLTVDSIMRGPELVGYPPSDLRFSGDAQELYFEWRQPGEDEAATYAVARPGGEPRRLSDEERRLAPGEDCRWDESRRLCLFEDEGDVVLVDTVAHTRRQITRTTAAESDPRFTTGGTAVTFVRDQNLFRVPLAAGGDVTVQVTNAGPKKKEPDETASQRFLKEEERKLLKHVAEAAARTKRKEDEQERAAPPRLDLAEGQTVPAATVSDDGRFAYVVVATKPKKARTADVPDYVTESAYTEMIPTRSNVGDAQEARRLAIVDNVARKVAWAWVEGVTEPEPEGKNKEQDAKPEGEADKPAEEKMPAGRAVLWSAPSFSTDGRLAAAVVRAADNKDRWLVLLDGETGRGRVLDAQHDDAWIRPAQGAGFGWIDATRVYFLSEATGFQHLYVLDTAAGSPPRALTSGRYEVYDARLSRDRRTFYVTTSQDDPGERHLYALPVAGGPAVKLTTRTGAHAAVVGPDDATVADVHSNARTPPEVYLGRKGGDGAARQVTQSTRAPFRTYAWREPRVVRFGARDGTQVPARLFTPEDVGAARDPLRPGVVFVHGAGWLQNAHRYWSQYYREYMFHHLLASRGYVVLDVDYRGSAGYGRDWRTAVAGFMGGHDLNDVVDGAGYLAAKEGVDPRRIGVYGGSYGGFITLMALFTSPDTFAAGAALRPVTDWAHYNHGYTSSILGAPPADAAAYQKSSPIHFADGLKSALLICHGMVDTNVHFQDSVRLAQKLIELRKENWELAVYPVENHAFEEATSWADEYRRILALFEKNLRTKPQS